MPVGGHGTRNALITTIEKVAPDSDIERIADAVMELLHRQRLITFRPSNQPELLTSYGRFLCDLLENPGTSLASAATRVGMADTNARYLMTRLVEAGMAVRTRVGGIYRYQIVPEAVLNHRDSTAYLHALVGLADLYGAQETDSTTGEPQ